METSEFAVELRKTEEKGNVMENLYVGNLEISASASRHQPWH